MIEVLNLEKLVPESILAVLSQDGIQAVLADLGDAAYAHWLKSAMAKLNSTRRDYVAGIQQPELADGTVTVALVGMLANMVEHDQPEKDMHDTLLGPNVPEASGPGQRGKRKGKHGYYRAVPFRHAINTSGYAAGVPMGAAYAKQLGTQGAADLGKKIYAAAKKLEATTGMPGQPVKYGGRLEAGLAPILQTYKKNKPHKTDIYAGMIRSRKTYEKATQTTYSTFRTISENPKTRPSWIRPPTQGVHLAQETSAFVQKIAPKAFEAYLKSVGGSP